MSNTHGEQFIAKGAKAKFGLSNWAWLVYVASVVVLCVVAPLLKPVIDSFIAAALVGGALGILAVSIIPGFAAFYIGHRSRKAANITFCVFVVIGLAGQINLHLRERRQHDAMASLSGLLAESRTGVSDPDQQLKRSDEVVRRLEKAAEVAPKSVAPNLRVSSINGKINEIMRSYQQAQSAALGASPLHGGKGEVDQLRQFREAAGRFKRENDKLRTFMNGLQNLVQSEARAAELSQQDLAALNRWYVQAFGDNRQTFQKMRDQDDEFMDLLTQTADLLDAERGHWQFDDHGRGFLFEKDESLKKFSDISRRLQELTAEQQKLQSELVKCLQAMQ